MIGLGISTFFRAGYPLARLSTFKKCIDTLLASEFPGIIYLVDDGSVKRDHLDYVKEVDVNKKINIFERSENGGLSKVKNTCLRLLIDSGVDVGFLADDDVIFLHHQWFQFYLDAIEKTGISHFSYYIYEPKGEVVPYNNYDILRTPLLNGCLITFTKELIEKVGYFKVLPYKYGHEHTNFTFRCIEQKLIPFYCDIINSHDYITTDLTVKSIEPNQDSIANNSAEAFSNLNQYISCIE